MKYHSSVESELESKLTLPVKYFQLLGLSILLAINLYAHFSFESSQLLFSLFIFRYGIEWIQTLRNIYLHNKLRPKVSNEVIKLSIWDFIRILIYLPSIYPLIHYFLYKNPDKTDLDIILYGFITTLILFLLQYLV
jgi:hypothetical protein